jgi:Protein of unknown function (DUF2817)
MTAERHFSADYSQARMKFRIAAQEAGAKVQSFPCPAVGPKGEVLYTDVARIGSTTARRILLIVSATHGAEGFCGSGIQVGWLASGVGRALPADLAVVLVHAINPYGFAWIRRVTEDNVDLNRNCLDHSKQRPANPGYLELHEALVPREWTPEAVRAADAKLAAYRERNGLAAFQVAVAAGQYERSDGLFFGGFAPTWSNRTLREIAGEHGANAREFALIDLHTGLGPYGYGEPIIHYDPNSEEFARALDWYGDSIGSAQLGTSSAHYGSTLKGSLREAVGQSAPHARHLHMGLEFGTRPLDYVLRALRADNWLHLYGEVNSPLGQEIKAMVRDAFFRDHLDWKRLVALRGELLIARAIAGLARS